MLVGVLVIHTIAIVSRIYISGRAPVINLYSSAVFIGWACVLLGLVLEVIYPIGIANLVAAFIGIATLSVARSLDTQRHAARAGSGTGYAVLVVDARDLGHRRLCSHVSGRLS